MARPDRGPGQTEPTSLCDRIEGLFLLCLHRCCFQHLTVCVRCAYYFAPGSCMAAPAFSSERDSPRAISLWSDAQPVSGARSNGSGRSRTSLPSERNAMAQTASILIKFERLTSPAFPFRVTRADIGFLGSDQRGGTRTLQKLPCTIRP